MMIDRLQCALGVLSLGAILPLCHAQKTTEPGTPQITTDAATKEASAKNPPKPTLLTVITVTGEPLAISLAPASATIVDGEQIRSGHALTSIDIMRSIPTLYVAQNGSSGSLGTVTIRGGKPNLVLTMIDGIPANDLSNLLGGAFDFSTLLTHDLERIEVVSGPLSSGYGSEAVSGVINVITTPTHYEPNVYAGGVAGSFGAAGTNFGAEGLRGRMGYKLSGSFLRMGEQVESDAFSMSDFSLASNYIRRLGTTFNWTARWMQFDGSGFPEGGGGPELSILRIPKTSNSGNVLCGFLAKHRFNDLWMASVNADVFNRGEHAYTPAILDSPNPSPASQPSTDTRTEFTRSRVALQNVINLRPMLQFHINLRGADEIGHNSTLIGGVYPSQFRDNRGISDFVADMVYSTRRITGMMALGIDKTAGFNVQLAPRVGAALSAGEGTILKASWGRAFKVPSLYALGNPNVGNPNLLPEEINAIDVSFQHQFGQRANLGGTYYYNLFSNLIDFSATAFRLVNRTQVRTQGVETAASFALTRGIQVNAWGAFLNWRVKSSIEPLRNEPRWNSGLTIEAKLSKAISALSTTTWVDRRYDFQVPAPAVTSVGGFSTTNLVLAYDGLKHTSIYARTDNLFNSKFHEYLGYPNPGISAQVGVTYRLR